MKKKWFFADYYDTTIILLALISVILVLLGFAEMIDLDNPPYSIIDLVIWGVFVIDYSWRFFTTKRKWRFILPKFQVEVSHPKEIHLATCSPSIF